MKTDNRFADYWMFITHLVTHHNRKQLFQFLRAINPNYSNDQLNVIIDFLFDEKPLSHFDVNLSIVLKRSNTFGDGDDE